MNTVKIILIAACMQLGVTHAAGDYTKAVKANNEFGFRFYQAIRNQDTKRVQNRFVSPISGYMALSMLSNGGQGATEAAVLKTIESSHLSRTELNQANRELLDLLKTEKGQENPVILELANSLWSNEPGMFRGEYSELLRNSYDAEARTLDFSKESSADTINSWTSEKTHDRIKDIVKFPLKSNFYLLNATYFKGPWTHPFNEKHTKNERFYLDSGKHERVPMMHTNVNAAYAKTDDYEVVELAFGPYRNASLVALLPTGSVADLENKLDAQMWGQVESLLEGYSSVHAVTLSLPKFKFDYEADLIQPLTDLGMGIAFGPLANFEDMIRGPVVINKALQKTFLSVNEVGAEAAAVTVIGGITSIPNFPKATATFNRPFVVAIRDNKTRAMLFVGTVANP